MSKYHFHLLLSRYRKGECTYQEKQLVEQWFALLDSEKPKVKEEETQQIEERIWKVIQQRQQKKPTMYQWNLFSSRYWAAAAVLIVAIAWGGYQWLGRVERGISVKQLSNGLTHQTNNSHQTIVLRLDDGTEINLAPQSSLKYPAQFKSNNREVFLDGKAFFKVAHNPQKPFLVYTGEVVTKVLGTSFWIDTEGKNKAVEVSVVSGKVSVFQRDARNDFVSEKIKSGVILTPNQKVKYIEGSQAFETSLVENPVLLSKGEKEQEIQPALFVFDDIPLSEVVSQLEKAYGIEIILENENLKNCLFTADITKQPLFVKLDLLCASLNANYEVRGTKILVSGKGCSED